MKTKTTEEKLQDAINYLGEKWVLHPNFNFRKNPALMHPGSFYMAQIAKPKKRKQYLKLLKAVRQDSCFSMGGKI